MPLTGLKMVPKRLFTEKGKAMSRYIKLWERFYITDLFSKGAEMGKIRIDEKRCTGCGLCVRICPGDTLMLDEKDRGRLAFEVLSYAMELLEK